MEKREKTDFILEQMRLCLDTGDFARAQIISRKISERLLNHTDFQHEKERYYRMMIRYYSHVKQYLDVCRSYLSIYNTPSVKADESKVTPSITDCFFSFLKPTHTVGSRPSESGFVCGFVALRQRAEGSAGACVW